MLASLLFFKQSENKSIINTLRVDNNSVPIEYSKTCVKWPLKTDKIKILMTNGNLMKV